MDRPHPFNRTLQVRPLQPNPFSRLPVLKRPDDMEIENNSEAGLDKENVVSNTTSQQIKQRLNK